MRIQRLNFVVIWLICAFWAVSPHTTAVASDGLFPSVSPFTVFATVGGQVASPREEMQGFSASEGANASATLEVGFGGAWRAGVWTPLTLSVWLPRSVGDVVSANKLRLELLSPDGDGQTLRWETEVKSIEFWDWSGRSQDHPHTPPRFFPAGYRWEGDRLIVKTCHRLGSPRAWIHARLVAGNQVLLDQRFHAGTSSGFPVGLRDTQQIYVAIARGDPGLREAIALLAASPHDSPVEAVVSHPRDLPISPMAYQAVEAVILAFGEADARGDVLAFRQEFEALRAWVHAGGKLVVGAHPTFWKEMLAAKNPIVDWLIPGKFEQAVPLSRSRANAIETFTGGRQPFGGIGARPAASESLTYISEPRGRVQAAEGRLPLVVLSPCGLGTLTWCAFGLDSPPFSEWPERGLFFARVLNLPVASVSTQEQVGGFTRFGYDDLAGQLRSSLDRFPGVLLVPFGSIVLLMLVYIGLVGPADYFVFRRLGSKRWVAWAAFAAVVSVMSGITVWLGQLARGSQCRLRQIDLVDISAGDGWVRTLSWIQFYSPITTHVDIAFRPQLPTGDSKLELADGAIGWWGLPGEGFGGMNALGGGLLFERDVYTLRPGRDGMEGIIFRSGSSKAFTVQWSGVISSPMVASELRLKEDELSGWIRSQLPFEVEDCRIYFGRYVYLVDTFPAKGVVFVDRRTPRRDLRGYLTGTQLVREKDTYRTQTSPYDIENRDWNYVLNMMMFHEGAGGTGYTGLYHVAERAVDSTSLLPTGQAILVGRAKNPQAKGGTEIHVDVRSGGAEVVKSRDIVLRVVLPVLRQDSAAPPGSAL